MFAAPSPRTSLKRNLSNVASVKFTLRLLPDAAVEVICAKTFEAPRLANFRLGIHWTPDGKFVTYRDWANGIWKQDISGGTPVRLDGLPAEKLYGYGWSQDGKQFAFVRGVEVSDAVLISNSK